MVEELTSAIIRTPSGKQIVVEWGLQNEEQRVAEVMKQFYSQFETSDTLKDNKVEGNSNNTVHTIEEIKQEETQTTENSNINEENKTVSDDEHKEEKANKEVAANTTQVANETKATNTSEAANGTEATKNVEAINKNVEPNKNENTNSVTAPKTSTNQNGNAANTVNTNTKTGTGANANSQNTSVSGATMNLKAKSNEVVLQTNYFLSLRTALQLQTSVGGKIQKNGVWVNASQEEIKKYFLPNDENINKYKYQFLSLKATAGISEEAAAQYLKGKGILSGKAAIFLDAAKKNNINEIYLMAHACLETGNGTSKLATGVQYKGQTVYNMFGVGAYDNSAVASGARYAYNAGWTTPEKAIYGGAKFISENYINHATFEQDTLYEMRWNPGSPSKHQYATDVAWATKQAVWMENVYKTFENPHVTFDIPVYRAGTGY